MAASARARREREKAREERATHRCRSARRSWGTTKTHGSPHGCSCRSRACSRGCCRRRADASSRSCSSRGCRGRRPGPAAARSGARRRASWSLRSRRPSYRSCRCPASARGRVSSCARTPCATSSSRVGERADTLRAKRCSRRTLLASQNQPPARREEERASLRSATVSHAEDAVERGSDDAQMHLEPVHAGILAGMSNDVCFCWTPASGKRGGGGRS